MLTFAEIGVSPEIIKAIEEIGFQAPMPVQEKIIGQLLAQTPGDIITLAQTGTGKTAAFGLPLIQNTDISIKKVQHLILCPTRELCMQISSDLSSYSKYLKGIKIAAIYGGASMEKQVKDIKKGGLYVSEIYQGRRERIIDNHLYSRRMYCPVGKD